MLCSNHKTQFFVDTVAAACSASEDAIDQVGHYKGELDHKGRRSGLGRMEDHQRVYRLDKLEPAVEMERNCFNSGESGLATKWRDLER